MVETKEMKKYITVVGVLGIIQAVLLTFVWLYFYHLGQKYSAKDVVKTPPQISETSEKENGAAEKKKTCVRGGCSGQLCVDEKESAEIVTTCEYREEYGCYAEAACEVQSSGDCGFTETDELKACLQKTGIKVPAKKIEKEVLTKPEPM